MCNTVIFIHAVHFPDLQSHLKQIFFKNYKCIQSHTFNSVDSAVGQRGRVTTLPAPHVQSTRVLDKNSNVKDKEGRYYYYYLLMYQHCIGSENSTVCTSCAFSLPNMIIITSACSQCSSAAVCFKIHEQYKRR